MQQTEVVYVLGSGFSKALSKGIMPTLSDLGKQLRSELEKLLKQHEKSDLVGLSDNPELLLTYLAQDYPWKAKEEFHEDQALFYKVGRRVVDQIRARESEARQSLEDWGEEFIRLVHDEKATIITFNYDTLIEWLAKQADNIEVQVKDHPAAWPQYGEQKRKLSQIWSELYVIPLTPYAQRTAGVLAGPGIPDTFRILKLHGSVHWFYSGSQEFPGEEIYLGSLNGNPAEIPELIDKQPVIIPPVAEKSLLYKNNSLRYQWKYARDKLRSANEVIFIGYSLPSTDLTVKNLLQTTVAVNRARAYVVDTNPQVKEHYEETLGVKLEFFSSVEELVDRRLQRNPAQ